MIATAPTHLDPVSKMKSMLGDTAWNEVLADITEATAELTLAVEHILEGIPAGSIPGPINWADLHCTDIELVFNGDSTRVCVTIQEAGPEAYKLSKYVSDKLEKLGYNNIEVDTEW